MEGFFGFMLLMIIVVAVCLVLYEIADYSNGGNKVISKDEFKDKYKNKYNQVKREYLKARVKYENSETVNDEYGEEYILVEDGILYILKKLYNIEYYYNKGLPVDLETTIPLENIRYYSLEGGISTQQLGGKTLIVLNDNHRTISISSHFVYDLLLDHIPEKEYSNYIENKKEKGRKTK